MASYNQVDFIEQAILSVLNQSYQNFELIIVDGISTDGSLDVIKKYQEHPKVISFIEKDKGLYHARNKGILKATGDILGFLNTDDYYEIDALESVYDFFENDLTIDVVYGLNEVVDKNSNFVKRDCFSDYDKNFRIKKYRALPDQSTFILKKHIEYVGLYDSTFSIVADWDFWQRAMVLNLKFVPINKHISNFRIYDETLTFSPKFSEIRFIEMKRLYRKYNDVLISPFIVELFFRHYIKRPLKKKSILLKIYRKFKK